MRSYIRILIEEKRKWYKTIGTRFCPAIQSHVVFNALGFHHLTYSGSGERRNDIEILRRVKLLSLAISVICQTQNVSKYSSETNKQGKIIEYWKLEKKFKGLEMTVTVILRRIGKGNIIFYSIWDK